jgi:hypothetical protein
MGIETNIFNHIGIDLSPETVLFRNNIGTAVFERADGKKSYVAYGISAAGGGGTDTIGWTSKIITPDMVGQLVAIFTAIEIKTLEGVAEDDQKNFIKQVMLAGGYSGFATSKKEARAIVKK